MLTIVDAIRDTKLFRPLFQELSTWRCWVVLLKALFALQMSPGEAKIYRKLTGRKSIPKEPFRELWAIVGRRGGKSFIMSIIAVYLALFRSFKQYLSPGERGVIQVIAADRAQARVIFRYISAILNSKPIFQQYIQNETKESIELSTGVDIEVATCSFRTIRGRTVVCAILDEIAFWRVEGANPDKEILAAIRPSMATIPNSLLLVISSPYARFGVLYEHHKDYYGKDDSEVLVWQAPTKLMNPTISGIFIAKERLKDPSAARAEWDAEFREDIESYVNRDVVEACVVMGRKELPPLPGVKYSAFVDPSGGSSDSMTLAIAHEDEGRRVLDAVRERKPPFSPDAVVEEFCTLLKQYRIGVVRGDRYAGQWPRERFSVHGISYEVADKPKSDIYQNFLPLLNSKQVELLDSDRLVNQIVSLERKTTRGGKDSIDHPPGGIDDLANACAGVLIGEMGKTKGRIRVIDSEVTRVQKLPLEQAEEENLIPVYDVHNRLIGYSPRYPDGGEMAANLMAVHQQGRLICYQHVGRRARDGINRPV